MTYRSESRGIMYTAPPSGDDDTDVRPGGTGDDAREASHEETTEADVTEPEREAAENAERETPTLESTSATTDANWTGTVPADD